MKFIFIVTISIYVVFINVKQFLNNIQVCQHPHIRMREWGVEAITYLVQAAFQYHHTHPNLITEVCIYNKFFRVL